MKVLVTGATGFIGQHVTPILLDRGHEVVAVARNQEKAEQFPWLGRVTFVPCDISGQPERDWYDQFGAPEAIMHMAWSGLPNYDALFHYEQNLPSDYRFLKRLVETGVRRVLVAGTCFEYGMRSGALAENMPTEPANPYALAKDTLRKFLQSLQRETPFHLQWARLFYMHGPGQNSRSLLAQLDRAIDDGLTEFNMSGGEQLRDYLPVATVARRLVSLVEYGVDTGPINICSGKPVSVRHLVEQRIKERKSSIRPKLGYYPYSIHEPRAFWGDPERQNEALGLT